MKQKKNKNKQTKEKEINEFALRYDQFTEYLFHIVLFYVIIF